MGGAFELTEPSRRKRPSLEGLTVVVTASRRATELARLIENVGGSAYLVPTVGISPTTNKEDLEKFVSSVSRGEIDVAVFMTGPGVHTLMEEAQRRGDADGLVAALNSPRIVVVARSGKPRQELARLGVKVDMMPPPDEATAEGISKLLSGVDLSGKNIAILWHGDSSNVKLPHELIQRGAARVLECSVYVYSHNLEDGGGEVLRSMGFKYVAPNWERVLRLVEEIATGKTKTDAITFTSPPAARNLFDAAAQCGLEKPFLDAMNSRLYVVAIGPSTKATLEGEGVIVDVMPTIPAMGAMVTALAQKVTQEKV